MLVNVYISDTFLTCSSIGYIGEFEEIDDHRSGKIVVQLNGRFVFPPPSPALRAIVLMKEQPQQDWCHLPSLQRPAP